MIAITALARNTSSTEEGLVQYVPQSTASYDDKTEQISWSFNERIKVEEKALKWMRDDPRLAHFVLFVASRTKWPIRVEIYHDQEGGWEELHVVVLAEDNFDNVMEEWRKLADEIAQIFPLDVQMKAAVIYGD